jgi:hypothetical protein
MFALTNIAAAAVVVPALLGPAAAPDCQLERMRYTSADDRALARFAAATHDVVAFGRQGAVFTPDVAPILRFRLRLAAWQERVDAAETMDDIAATAQRAHGKRAVADGLLPELPDELEYRLAGGHLLLLNRRTRAVIDLLPHAFGR